MMKRLFIIPILALSLFGCKQQPKNEAITKVTTPKGDPVYVLDFAKLSNETKVIPLSSLVKEITVLPLETKEEAFIKHANTVFSDNYIGIRSWDKVPYKLFDYNGKYIRDIGKVGKGPGEYRFVYSTMIDEPNNRVYMMPWMNNKIIAFDTLGGIQEDIPLAYKTQKSFFRMKDGVITVMNMPFPEDPAVAFQQDMQGNVKHMIATGDYYVPQDYSNEIYHLNNTGKNDMNLFVFFNDKADSLYHYDPAKDYLVPQFTIQFAEERKPIHSYMELPHHILIDVSVPKQTGANSFGTGGNKYILFDKKNETAEFVELKNDFLGGIPVIMWDLFSNGRFVNNTPAISFKRNIDSVLIYNEDMDAALRTKLKALSAKINKSDNNILLYGDLK